MALNITFRKQLKMYKPFIKSKVFYWDCSDFILMNKTVIYIFKLDRSLALQLTITFNKD